MRFPSPTQRISFSILNRAGTKETDAIVWTRTVKTTRERAEEKRAEKLALVREQVESGSLVIRKMTDAERRRYPPRTPPHRREKP